MPESTAATLPAPESSPPRFADLGLPTAIVERLGELGFDQPTAIQAAAIPAMMGGGDVIGVAQTGTGKTAAFALPLLAAIDPADRTTQALVLTPTRELAIQVAQAVESFVPSASGIEVLAVYGGAAFLPQQRALQRGVQLVVGTPGRVIDHIERGTLSLADLSTLVLDEGDEMLRMGFSEEIDKILEFAPPTRQLALFSATMPTQIRRTAGRHQRDPQLISVDRSASTVAAITQEYAVVPFRHKAGALARLLVTAEASAAIVFTRTRAAAEELGVALNGRGVPAASISGDVPQREREKIVERLRDGRLQVLVATDVAARGLDVDQIELVVNFDLPREPDAYVHRIGRTGRAGRAGRAVSFVNPHERHQLRRIEKLTGTQLTEIEVPSPADVSRVRARRMLQAVPDRIAIGRLDIARKAVQELVEAGTDPLDIAAAVLAIAVGDTGPTWERERPAAGAAGEPREPRARLEETGRGHDSRPDRFAARPERASGRRDYAAVDDYSPIQRRTKHPRSYWVGVGRDDNAAPGAIVGAMTNEGGLTGSDLGRIEMFGKFSLIEVHAELSPEALRRLGGARVSGRALRIRPDAGPTTDKHTPARAPIAGARSGERRGGDRGYPKRADAGYPRRAEGGYPKRAEGGYPKRAEGGYPKRAEGGYPKRAGGGYPKRADAGYPKRAEGGYPKRAGGSYAKRGEAPYGERRGDDRGRGYGGSSDRRGGDWRGGERRDWQGRGAGASSTSGRSESHGYPNRREQERGYGATRDQGGRGGYGADRDRDGGSRSNDTPRKPRHRK